MLYDVTPFDPTSYIATAAVLLAFYRRLPLDSAEVEVLGDRWTPLLIREMMISSGSSLGFTSCASRMFPPSSCTSARSLCSCRARSSSARLAAAIKVASLYLRVQAPLIVTDPALHERIRFVQNSVGAVPGPFDCFLVHRGLRTLHLRIAAHTDNGRVVSEFLNNAEGVSEVRWPGFGGMVSFRHPDATRIAAATRVFSLAESLGGVESLIEVPQAMTHQSVEGSAAAVPPDLVRLSCGVEAVEDLVADLEQALRG